MMTWSPSKIIMKNKLKFLSTLKINLNFRSKIVSHVHLETAFSYNIKRAKAK